MLRPRLVGVPGDVTWVTPDTAQSRSLLAGEEVEPIPASEPRDVTATLATAGRAHRLLRDRQWSAVVSTGSLAAVPFMALARARGVPCHYIETAARVDDPSLTARILARVPGVHRYAQHRAATKDGWLFRGSVFDGFRATAVPAAEVRRVVVTAGTGNGGFRRMVDAVRHVLPPEAEVLWQTGPTVVADLGIDARPTLPARELAAAMAEADLVVAHAGVGSALMALRAGKCPVLLPRRQVYGEHVDDHQRQIADTLASAGLAVACEPEALTLDHLRRAAAVVVTTASEPPPFVLESN